MAEKNENGKGNGPKLIIIVLVLLIIMGAGLGFGGYFIYNKVMNNTTTAAHNTNANTNVLNPSSGLSAYTYSMDEFLVNLSDEGGKRFFKTKIYIGYDTKKKKDMDKELEEKKPILRDAINGVLRSKKATDLSTQKNVEDLKKELLDRINPCFESGKASNIYFYDILIQ